MMPDMIMMRRGLVQMETQRCSLDIRVLEFMIKKEM